METNQSSTNQNLTRSEAQPQQAGSNQKLFVAVVISVLLTSLLTGSAVYFWQKSTREKTISSLEQKISSLEKQISMVKKVETTPQPTLPPASSSLTPTGKIPLSSPTTTTDSTAGWETYVNTEYKYSIGYPSEYKIGSCRNCPDLSIADFITLDPPQKDRYGGIMVSRLRDRKSGETLEEYLENISGVDANPIVPGSKKRFRLDEYEALVTVTNNYGYERKNVFVTNGSNVIHFSFSGVASPSNKGMSLADYENIDVFDQILSTFKFTN